MARRYRHSSASEYAPPLVDPVTALAPRLQQFVAVAREEHLTHAAELLGVSQPALSRTMTRLEMQLGLPLFRQVGRGIQLTAHGRRLKEQAERALDLLEEVGQVFASEASGEHGVVGLAYLESMAADVVPALVRAFHLAHPTIRFRLVGASSADMVRMLRAGEVDLCLIAPAPRCPETNSTALFDEEICLVVPHTHTLADRPTVSLTEVSDEAFVAMQVGSGTRQIADDLCRAAGFEPRILSEGDDMEVVRGLVASGLGIALLPHRHTPRPGLRDLRLTDPGSTRSVCLTWHTGSVEAAPVTLFREFILSGKEDLFH